MGTKLWQKNYTLDSMMEHFTVRNDYVYDEDLVLSDLIGSAAHALGLRRIGILTEEETDSLLKGLDALGDGLSHEGSLVADDGVLGVDVLLGVLLAGGGEPFDLGLCLLDLLEVLEDLELEALGLAEEDDVGEGGLKEAVLVDEGVEAGDVGDVDGGVGESAVDGLSGLLESCDEIGELECGADLGGEFVGVEGGDGCLAEARYLFLDDLHELHGGVEVALVGHVEDGDELLLEGREALEGALVELGHSLSDAGVSGGGAWCAVVEERRVLRLKDQ